MNESYTQYELQHTEKGVVLRREKREPELDPEIEKIKTRKSVYIAISIISVVVLLFCLSCCIVFRVQIKTINSFTKYISFQTEIPVTTLSMIGDNDLFVVVQNFKDAGFVNIKTAPDGSLEKDNWKNERVYKVTVKGRDISLFAHRLVSKSAPVTIFYHSTENAKDETIHNIRPLINFVIIFVIFAALCIFSISKLRLLNNKNK